MNSKDSLTWSSLRHSGLLKTWMVLRWSFGEFRIQLEKLLNIQWLQSHGDELLCWSHVALLLANSFFVSFHLIFLPGFIVTASTFFSLNFWPTTVKTQTFFWRRLHLDPLHLYWFLIPLPFPWLKGISQWIWYPENVLPRPPTFPPWSCTWKSVHWRRQWCKINTAEAVPQKCTIFTYKKWNFFKMAD